MLLKLGFLLIFQIAICSKIPTYGTITILNNSTGLIRVVLTPALSWDYYEQRTNKTLVRNLDKAIGGNHIIPGQTKRVYFPLVNHESIASSKILLANVYDMEGNILLHNEYVLMGESYSFEKFSPSIHLLRELTSAINSSPKMGSTECPQTCPIGPPGPQGEPGQKGDRGTPGQTGSQGAKGLRGASGLTGPMGPPGRTGETGLTGFPGIKGESGSQGYPGQKGNRGTAGIDGIKGQKGEPGYTREPQDWCNLSNAGEIKANTVLSTSKHIIMLKPDSRKTFHEAESLCKSICGRIYFPSTLAENNEVFQIARKGGSIGEDIWLRLTDEETEGIWKDPENQETLTFENWEPGQPNNQYRKQHHANFIGNSGKWGDLPASMARRHVICEL